MNLIEQSLPDDPISDDELVLYHYRDGLSAARIAEIEDRLFIDPALRRRMNQLLAILNEVDALPLPEPDAAFEERVWTAIAPELDRQPRDPAPSVVGGWRQRLAALMAPRPIAAVAVVALVAIGTTSWLGAPAPAVPPPIAATGDGPRVNELHGGEISGAARVRSYYVAEHLRATERLLLTVANDRGASVQPPPARVADLLAANRVYQQAAERSGDPRVATVLRRVEPLLIDLANRDGAGAIQDQDGWRAHLQRSDLLFQMRAVGAALSRDAARPSRPS